MAVLHRKIVAGICYPAPDFRAEHPKLQACATSLIANDTNRAGRASGGWLPKLLRIFPPTNAYLWAQKILASPTNEEAAPARVWPGKAHERSAPTLGRAAAKEGAGQDLPEPLGPAASQTLDPPAGNPTSVILS